MQHRTGEIILVAGNLEQDAHGSGLGGIFAQSVGAQPQGFIALPAKVLREAEHRLEGYGIGMCARRRLELVEGQFDLSGLQKKIGDPHQDLLIFGIERGHLPELVQRGLRVTIGGLKRDNGMGVKRIGAGLRLGGGMQKAGLRTILLIGEMRGEGKRNQGAGVHPQAEYQAA